MKIVRVTLFKGKQSFKRSKTGSGLPPHRQSARQREGRDRLSAMNADKKDKFLVCPKKAKNGEKQVMQANAFLKINKILSGL